MTPSRQKAGFVWLVGAGPGDPDLLTLRGHRLLHQAEVVLTDALVSPSLYQAIRGTVIHAGKRGPGAPHGCLKRLSQQQINRLLVKLVRQGKKVVRLKGGDPFFFGRGSEEVEALRQAGLPYEVVPGVSSALAAPVSVGVPVTDRRWASQVTFITGKEGREAPAASRVQWDSLSPRGTLVVLMGVSEWPVIARRLLRRGWPHDKPVLAIQSATLPTQRVITTTLSDAALAFRQNQLRSPAVIVVGEVARFYRPLYGSRIVVTRAADQTGPFAAHLEALGARVIRCPVIKVVYSPDFPAIKKAAIAFSDNQYDAVLLLSTNAVAAYEKAFSRWKSHLPKQRYVVVGPKTAAAVRARGWRVWKQAEIYSFNGVMELLGAVKGKQFLLPRAADAPEEVPRALTQKGATVDRVALYQTQSLPISPAVRRDVLKGVHAVTFTSSSTVRAFAKAFSRPQLKTLFKNAQAFSIGPQTTETLKREGISSIVQADVFTTEGMVETFTRTWKENR